MGNNDWIGWLIGLGGVALGVYALTNSANAQSNSGTDSGGISTLADSTVANTTGPLAALNSELQSLFVPKTQYAGQGQIGISDDNAANELVTLQNLLTNTSKIPVPVAAVTHPTVNTPGITFDTPANAAAANQDIAIFVNSGAAPSYASAVENSVFSGESGTTPGGNTVYSSTSGGTTTTMMF